MDLKTLLGADFKEGMTLEEINAALAGKTFVDPTTLPASVSKEQYDKAASEAADYKRKLAEAKAAGLTDAEKLKQAQEEAQAMKRDYALRISRMEVEKVLITAGLAEADYSTFIDALVTEDAAASTASAAGIAKVLAAQKKATDAAVRKELQDNAAKPGADMKKPAMKKEEFMKLSLAEQSKCFTEHREEYEAMYGKQEETAE